MKLLTVGSAPQSDIVLNSKFVSGYHADLIFLDNGDILVCDRSSTNGTFLKGGKIAPETEVMVRRGEELTFADTPLNWSFVPEVRPDPNARKLISIGSNPKNQIHIAGSRVSRFHATIKQTNDGKWYLCDHSANGTTLNNIRIPKDTFVRIKKGDVIKCAGMPVENPIQGRSSNVLWWSLAGIAACLILFFVLSFIKFPRQMNGEKIYAKYSSSSVLIVMGYHYKVTAGSLDAAYAFGSLNECIVDNGRLVPYESNNSMLCFATGFYISEDGLIVTNLHVARPWLFDKNIQPVEDLIRAKLNLMSKTDNSHYANYISQVKAEGVVDFIYAIPHKQYFDGHNAMSCTELVTSNDTEIDIAILKAMLPGNKLQEGATYVDLNTIPDRSAYKQGSKLYTIGFPDATRLQNIEKKTLEAVFSEGHMIQNNNNYDFGHSALTTNGSSGSPVFNERGQLLGIVSSGYGNGYNYAVRSEFLLQLLDKAEKNNIL